MGVARERTAVALAPERAFRLWLDVRRWPTFVDGFGHVDRKDGHWPEPGARVVWTSRPGGRGTVTEKVAAVEPPHWVAADVFDSRLSGRQTVTFEPDDGGSLVDVELDYTLTQGGPLRAVADALYIRRALRDSLRRTLRRFATEAAEEAALLDEPA